MTHYQRAEPRWTRRAAARLLFGAGAALCLSSWPRMAPPYAMLKRTIPSSGETLPVVGLGTWLTFDIGADEAARARRREVLLTLLDSGGTLVDSSPMYGRSEEVIGQLSAGLPGGERLFKATKVWIRGREAGIEQMRESMRRMGAEPVDLMQVHNLVDWRTHLATLRAWKADGRVRYIGITHYLASAYEEVESILRAEPLDFLQINYSLRTPQAEDRLFPLALDKGVAVIVNRPFEGGDFFRATRGKSLPSLAAELGCRSWAQY
jgi:diketogulonate reductase-like aldo/keto reductase